MKILEIDYDYYSYPDGISSIKEFIDYANKHYHSFIQLTQFDRENCVFPYFIKEETSQIYVNTATLSKVKEVEATILSRTDYDARLKKVVEKKCIDCVYYTEDSEGDNLKGHRGRISLDGECPLYNKKAD